MEHDPCIPFNRAAETFIKHIPFKVYCVANDKVTGTADHTHDYMQIWYVISGSCEHLINNKSHLLARGNLFILPPYITHRIKITEGETVKIIGCEFSANFINENISWTDLSSSLFDFAYIEPFLVSTESLLPRLQLTGRSQLKVEELMLDMLSEFEQENKYYEINLKANLLKLLCIVAREYDNQCNPEHHALFERYRDAINCAIKYIDDNYSAEIYIEEICKIAMMSQTYFSRLFKTITGKTFVEYINSLRINKAMQLLKDTEESITDICYLSGFNDAAYFNKVFKKENGLSPKQYRNVKISEKE